MGSYTIVKCNHCQSAYVWPRPSREEMDAYYQDEKYVHANLQEHLSSDDGYFPTSKDDAIRIITLCKKFVNGDEFLDIGAGFGEFSYEATRQGFNVTACEPSPTSREVFYNLNGFQADPNVVDSAYAESRNGRYDVVLLSQVLEHISDPEKVVYNIHTLLKPGGIAAIGVPHFGSLLSMIQGQNDMYITPPEHLNFFSKIGLNALFDRLGFDVEKVSTVSKFPRAKMAAKVGVPLLSEIAWRFPYSVLKLAETFDKGMILNAYYRKR